MATTITFFPVDNGDMTLIKFGDAEGTTLLIDTNIRQDADDPDEDARDVAKDLRERLKKDDQGRPYVDAFLLTHPDQDHCRGLPRHFHLGPLADYPKKQDEDEEEKIVIRELWSSPIVFRRKKKETPDLCEEAEAFSTEARRRVRVNKDKDFTVDDGDRIQVLGEDIEGKTDDLGPILVKVGESISNINGKSSSYFTALLLAPLEAHDDESEEECLAKNRSSVVLNFRLAADAQTPDSVRFLTGGDAEWFIWNQLHERHKDQLDELAYDLLQAPHHCSWHSLSEDSWSELGEKVKVDEGARTALAQARDGAAIVASCKAIADDESDPPCIRAKREYEAILDPVDGEFYCTGEYPSSKAVEPLEFTVTKDGIQPPGKKDAGVKVAAVVSSARTPLPHGAP